MKILYEACNEANDILLVDNELSVGQEFRDQPPLSLSCGNGCEDGAINLTHQMAVQLRDALNEFLEGK